MRHRERAFAKVNLTLHVLGRRPDGYHEIRSLMVPISLADELEVVVGATEDGISVPGRPDLEGPENLCLRAVQSFRRHVVPVAGIFVRLEKRIPTAAGLGGGSSDAAAVLRVLAREAGVDLDDPRLVAAALEVGSDVPFFLRSEPALAAGRGEVLSPAPPLPDEIPLVLLHPPFGISAGEAYAALAASRAGEVPPLPPPLEPLPDARAVASILHNDLQAPVAERYPIRPMLGTLEEAGALGVLMSGSGPTVFGVFVDRDAAEKAAAALRGRPGCAAWVVTAGRSRASLVPP
ncbi:MAG: 4-(cytidine 5'-diphospho)-2-C-methyl-D-erythritol kinase [Pseudomonadota bacterium]